MIFAAGVIGSGIERMGWLGNLGDFPLEESEDTANITPA